MEALFTAEQDALRDAVARFLQNNSSITEVRRLMETDSGYDSGVWSRFCRDMGAAGLHLPSAFGGLGLGAVELGVVQEEMGRALFCGPFFSSSVMAGCALRSAREESRERLLPGLASGDVLYTLVLDSLSDPCKVGSQLTVSRNSLSGTAPIVIDAAVVDRLVVVARDHDRLRLLCVDREEPGVMIDPLESIDATRKLYRAVFNDVACDDVGEFDERELQLLWRWITVALAHECIGGAEALLGSTVEYTKMRLAFGRPIGSFQALKHRCADLLVDLERARSTTYYAAQCLDSGDGDPYAANMAKAMASEVYTDCARQAIQLRGGIGFTWENDTHLWYKRAKSSEVLMGAPHLHREQMIRIIEETEPNV